MIFKICTCRDRSLFSILRLLFTAHSKTIVGTVESERSGKSFKILSVIPVKQKKKSEIRAIFDTVPHLQFRFLTCEPQCCKITAFSELALFIVCQEKFLGRDIKYFFVGSRKIPPFSQFGKISCGSVQTSEFI